jgi:hypothetical protein
MKPKPTVHRVDGSPLKLLCALEVAHRALASGDVATGAALVDQCVQRLAHAKANQDQVLDECAQTPEVRAPRVTPPQGDGVES